METTGEYRIPAKVRAVWTALHDPDILKGCITGCEELTRAADGSLKARIGAKIGPMKTNFTGDVVFSDLAVPDHCSIAIAGDGGALGSAKGALDVKLSEQDGATLLAYALTDIQLGGTLAHLDRDRIDTVIQKLADQFFGEFAQAVGGDGPTVTAPSLATPGGDEAAQEELVDRLEHRVEDFASDVAEAAEEVEEELEVAAGRGFLGGPYVWGLLIILVGIVILAILR